MVNLVEAGQSLLHAILKLAGLRQQTIMIEPGTVMSFWAPKKTNSKHIKEKPAVILVHGFAADGIMTWLFQFGTLTSKYSVYIPDLLFFGGSTTNSNDRSPNFQAECLIKALDELGVEECTVVGFSYGGMVAFKMAEARPEIVKALVVSGSVIAMTDSISDVMFERLGFKSSAELLLPESVKGLKDQLSVAMYKKLWLPDFFHRDYLKVMFSNRKERGELLEGMVIRSEDAEVPNFPQTILLLWGENDNIFNMELAQNMLVQLGKKSTLRGIKNAGHLVHLERPCVYNRRLKKFLALVNSQHTTEQS